MTKVDAWPSSDKLIVTSVRKFGASVNAGQADGSRHAAYDRTDVDRALWVCDNLNISP